MTADHSTVITVATKNAFTMLSSITAPGYMSISICSQCIRAFISASATVVQSENMKRKKRSSSVPLSSLELRL